MRRFGSPQRRRGQRAGLPCRGPLGGAPVPGTRLLLVLAAAYPAAPPDEGLRGRGRGLPAAIGDPGVRDPASGGTDSGQYPYSAPAGSAFLGVSGAAARRVGQRAVAVAVALRPVTASHRWCHSDRSDSCDCESRQRMNLHSCPLA